MGSCIICGTSTDGPICEVHEEDVVFEFEGNQPSQLTPGRFYVGSVDGYADFGVFINIGNVTGLLHRSKLDRRLESLEWEVGDNVCVQVNNVRDNGDIDLDWSIRETPEDFRGHLLQTPEGDSFIDEDAEDGREDDEDDGDERGETATDTEAEPEPKAEAGTEPEPDDSNATPDAPEPTPGEPGTTGGADEQTGGSPGDAELSEIAADSPDEDGSTDDAEGDDIDAEHERVTVESLEDRVGDTVRLEGTIASVRQTSGPTVFELEDETGIVDCAAFVEAGVRAYPDIEGPPRRDPG
jgi:predicted RNA-binding protein with RPS1 domain